MAKTTIPPLWFAASSSTPKIISLPARLLPSQPGTEAPETLTPIYLTPISTTDAPAMQATLSIPSISGALISPPHPYTLADAEQWTAQVSSPTTRQIEFAIRIQHPESGLFIGCIGLTPSDPDELSGPQSSSELQQPETSGTPREGELLTLGYYLHTAYQKRGIMSDAVAGLLAYATSGPEFVLQRRGVKEVAVEIGVENEASNAVMKNYGWEEGWEGKTRQIQWPESKGGRIQHIRCWVWKVPQE